MKVISIFLINTLIFSCTLFQDESETTEVMRNLEDVMDNEDSLEVMSNWISTEFIDCIQKSGFTSNCSASFPLLHLSNLESGDFYFLDGRYPNPEYNIVFFRKTSSNSANVFFDSTENLLLGALIIKDENLIFRDTSNVAYSFTKLKGFDTINYSGIANELKKRTAENYLLEQYNFSISKELGIEDYKVFCSEDDYIEVQIKEKSWMIREFRGQVSLYVHEPQKVMSVAPVETFDTTFIKKWNHN